MNYALMLDDAGAEAVRMTKGDEPVDVNECDVFGALDAATLVAIPDEWADVAPASPLPWERDDTHVCPPGEGSLIERKGLAKCLLWEDARYIVAACNDFPAALAKLAEQASELEKQRVVVVNMAAEIARLEASLERWRAATS